MIGIVIGVVVIVVIAGVILHGKMQSDSPQKEQPERQTKEQAREQVKEKAVQQPAKAKAAAEPQAAGTGAEGVKTGAISEDVPAAAEKADEKTAGQADGSKTAGEKDELAQAKELEKRQRAQAAAEERNLKGELYRFLNHGLQVLYTAYSNDDAWKKTEVLGTVSPALYEKLGELTDKLPAVTKELLTEYLACMEFGKETANAAEDEAENAAEDAGTKEVKEEVLCAFVKDRDRLKAAFLKCMMPFYPFYCEEFKKGGLRHTALLAPDTLRLYHQLTGKNFRPGYRNRYKSGVRAFEWEKNRYRIFAQNGDLLCDAVFEDGKIVSGTGRSTERDPKNPDWNIVRVGEWKEGVFTERTVRYEYRKPVNI